MEKFYEKLRKKDNFWHIIKNIRNNIINHTLRCDNLLNLIIKRYVEGKIKRKKQDKISIKNSKGHENKKLSIIVEIFEFWQTKHGKLQSNNVKIEGQKKTTSVQRNCWVFNAFLSTLT